MKKINLLLLMALMIMSCAPTAKQAEKSLVNFMHEQNYELATCNLVCVGTNNFDGYVTHVLTESDIQKMYDENLFSSLLAEQNIAVYDKLIGETVRYKVHVLYDKRTIAITENEMTSESEEMIQNKIMSSFFNLMK